MSLSALFVLRRRAATCLYETSHGAEATFLSTRHTPQGHYPSTSASTPVYSTHSILKNPHFPRISRWKTQLRSHLHSLVAPRRHAPGAHLSWPQRGGARECGAEATFLSSRHIPQGHDSSTSASTLLILTEIFTIMSLSYL